MNSTALGFALVAALVMPAAGATLLFSDNFDAADSADVNNAYDGGRQSGSVGNLQYYQGNGTYVGTITGTISNESSNGTSTSITGTALVLNNGTNTACVSIGRNFDDAMVLGQYLSIRFTVDPMTASAGTSANWVAITMGASDNASFGSSGTGARGQYVTNTQPNVAMLLRDNGQYALFNNGSSAGSGTYDSTPTVGLTHQIEIRIRGLVDGNPWDGVNSAYFEFLADGNTTPYATYTKTNGYADNFITLMSDSGGSQFDNLEVWLVPEPSSFILSLFAGIGLLMRRKRHA